MSATATATSTDTAVRRGFRVTCPLCKEEGACVTVLLGDLSELHCNECDADFDLDLVRSILASWLPIVRWLDLAPTVE